MPIRSQNTILRNLLQKNSAAPEAPNFVYDIWKVNQIQTYIAKNLESVKVLLFTSEILNNLMNDLMDFTQIEKNYFRLNKEYYNLLTLIEKSLMQLDHISSKKNITFVLPSPSKD